MKHFQNVISIILIAGPLFILMFFCGCSSNNSDGTITDAVGRKIDIPSEVKSVATVGAGARYVIYAGAQDKLIAVTDMDKSNRDTIPYTQAYATLFATLPSTSNGNALNETTVDIEALLNLKPDIIISSRSKSECDELQTLTHIPVIAVTTSQDVFCDEVYTSILNVGTACGTQSHAEKVVTALKDWANELNSLTKNIADSDKPSVYVGAINFKGSKGISWTYSYYAPLVAINTQGVADSKDLKGSREISLEDLGNWNPDYIFLNMANKSIIDKEITDHKDFFSELSAFKNGCIYSQPAFNYNGTNIEVAVCDAFFCGKILYPDAFEHIDIDTVYKSVFSTMIGTDDLSALTIKPASFTKVEAWK